MSKVKKDRILTLKKATNTHSIHITRSWQVPSLPWSICNNANKHILYKRIIYKQQISIQWIYRLLSYIEQKMKNGLIDKSKKMVF